MQRKNSFKFHKRNLCILILFVMIYSMFSFIPQLMNKTYAATYTYSKSKKDVPSNFDTTYPGYKSLLDTMIKEHPNWTFKLYETGLDWKTVINNEYRGHGSAPKNLSPATYPIGWICYDCRNIKRDNGSWRCASREAIEYMMDPRNSANSSDVFQFLLLSNDKNITKEQVKTMASKISYLNTNEIITAIYDSAQELDINPFYIIGKILQEQGSNGSVMCSGKGYKGKYVGYYNFFNVGASGDTNDQVISKGLSYAKSEGWNTPKKSIIGGIGVIKRYINRGQDTLYYQKFNVTYLPYYVNQYAQNVLDAQNIGTELRSYYEKSKLLDGSFTFEIPLYKNMPKSACKKPSTMAYNIPTGENAYINVNVGYTLALRDSPDGATIANIDSGEKVIILKRASSKINGTYWDEVYSKQGTGYMAREAKDGSKTYLVVIKQYQISGSNIMVAPGTTISAISGGKNTSSVFGTGAKISLEGKTYNLVMLGDVNGDGKVKATDYVLIKNYIMNGSKMNEIQQKAADVNKDGKVKATDYVLIKNYIMNGQKITL